MRVDSIFTIKERGIVCCVQLDSDREPLAGDYLECNGKLLLIKGVEWFAVPRRPKTGDSVGLLVEDRAAQSIAVGHDVSVVPQLHYYDAR